MTRRTYRSIKVGVGVVLSAGALAFASPAFASHGPDAKGAAKFGLCHAYFKGSTTGKNHKHKHSAAFKKLEAAAKAQSETVAAFCADAKPGNPTAEPNRQGPPSSVPNHLNGNAQGTSPSSIPHPANTNGHGTPPTSPGGTGVANSKSHDGAGLNGTTTADSASDGHSANGSANAGAHRP